MPQLSQQFLSEMPATSMRLSKIVGTPVIGLDHHGIGKIGEVLLDRDGKAVAVVIGAGGVLGIGGQQVSGPETDTLLAIRDALGLSEAAES